jgi:hypothetical protein
MNPDHPNRFEDQPSLITKYHYKGVPDSYKVDEKNEIVKLRKRRQDDQQAFDTYLGCTKFNTRQ